MLVRLVAALMLVSSSAAFGQTANSGSASNSGAASQSGAAALSGSGVSTVTTNIGTGGGTPSTFTSSDVTVRSAPQVYVPSVIGGNVCAVGASGGASWLGAGFAFGATWESDNCERRQLAALMYNAGWKEASRELLCSHKPIYEAMKTAGTPCAVRPDYEPPSARPPVAVLPGPVVQPTPIQPARAAFTPTTYRNRADCLTAASAAGQPLASCSSVPI
jgi:hypothetical protein